MSRSLLLIFSLSISLRVNLRVSLLSVLRSLPPPTRLLDLAVFDLAPEVLLLLILKPPPEDLVADVTSKAVAVWVLVVVSVTGTVVYDTLGKSYVIELPVVGSIPSTWLCSILASTPVYSWLSCDSTWVSYTAASIPSEAK